MKYLIEFGYLDGNIVTNQTISNKKEAFSLYGNLSEQDEPLSKSSTKVMPFDLSEEVQRLRKMAVKQSEEDLYKIPRHLLDEFNPNHPNYDNYIFGYRDEGLLAKQYK